MIIFEGAQTISTQNLNPTTGVPTALSTALLDMSKVPSDTASVQIVGTYTGALTPQVSNDGVNWKTMGGLPLVDVTTGIGVATVASASQTIYQVDVSAYRYFRLSANAAVTGAAVVTLVGTESNGLVGLDMAIPAGSAQIGLVGTPAGSQIALTSAATTNATSSKSTAGNLFEIAADNFNAAARFLKLYNKASAPTVGTDVPVLTIPIPANGSVCIPFGTIGKRFTTGIAFAITGLQAVADTTAIAAGEVHVHGSYI